AGEAGGGDRKGYGVEDHKRSQRSSITSPLGERKGEGEPPRHRLRTARLRRLPLTFPLLRNGPLPLPEGRGDGARGLTPPCRPPCPPAMTSAFNFASSYSASRRSAAAAASASRSSPHGVGSLRRHSAR